MTQIDELQSRITRALDRIAQGVEHMSLAPPPAPEPEPQLAHEPEIEPASDSEGSLAEAQAASSEEIERLQVALDEEKMANAQLEQRVKLLNGRIEEMSSAAAPAEAPAAVDAALQEQMAAQRESLAGLDAELQRLRMSNEMLRRTNEEMRGALEANVGEPHLINKAMLAELEALRASRAADEAETRMVLSAMEPLLAEAAKGGAAQ